MLGILIFISCWRGETVSKKELESIIRWLNHATYVLSLSRHFLTNLWEQLKEFNSPFSQQQLSNQELEGLLLWLLGAAFIGISLNGLMLRCLTRITFSDSCPAGVGGFTSAAQAWRLKINKECIIHGKTFVNNVLEFLRMAISIWLSINKCYTTGKTQELILALGKHQRHLLNQQTSHLRKDNVSYPAAKFIARKIANLLAVSGNFLDTQHLAGAKNNVLDLLTFDGTNQVELHGVVHHHLAHDSPSNAELTCRFLTFFPQLVP